MSIHFWYPKILSRQSECELITRKDNIVPCYECHFFPNHPKLQFARVTGAIFQNLNCLCVTATVSDLLVLCCSSGDDGGTCGVLANN